MTLAAILRHLMLGIGVAVLSAIVVRIMIAVRVMDTPEARKAHTRPTPKGGGVGIVLAFLVGIAVLYRYAEFARLADPYFRGVIEASVAIAVVAFLDDLYDWPFTIKLGAQVLAALVAVSSGLYVTNYHFPYIGPLAIGWIGVPAIGSVVGYLSLNWISSKVRPLVCAAPATMKPTSLAMLNRPPPL